MLMNAPTVEDLVENLESDIERIEEKIEDLKATREEVTKDIGSYRRDKKQMHETLKELRTLVEDQEDE